MKSDYPNVHIVKHALVALKLTELRDATTPPARFRRRLQEISMLLAMEALRDLEIKPCRVRSPLAECDGAELARPVTIVPILRAGLGVAESIANLLPEASIGHIGMFRDEQSLHPQHYYFKMPPHLAESAVVLVDPMLATGNSAIEAVNKIKSHGASDLRLICLVACPEGLRNFTTTHPDVRVTLGVLDESLNEHGYILPGLGDAGDRFFGT